MNPESLIESSEPILLSETIYEGDQSPEIDARLKSEDFVEAYQKNFSPETYNGLLFSSWHVPCHSIITHTKDGAYQIFHVQPNNPSYTLLSHEQESALQKLGGRDTEAIVVKGTRAWFGPADEKELENMHIKQKGTIDVDTSNWWRILFDIEKNEIWIDIRDKHTLRKYIGF